MVNCGTLTNLTNGQVSHTAGTTFGQPATYSCNPGYNLMGNSTRTCQATGEWSGSDPSCQRVFQQFDMYLKMILLLSYIFLYLHEPNATY